LRLTDITVYSWSRISGAPLATVFFFDPSKPIVTASCLAPWVKIVWARA